MASKTVSKDRIARRAASVGTACVALLAANVPGAVAYGPAVTPGSIPRVGTDGQGVSIINHGGVAFQFAPAAASRAAAVAGRKVAITCGRVSNGQNGLLTSTAIGHSVVRTAPTSGTILTTGIHHGGDFCALGIVKRKSQTLVAIVSETRRGALFLNQDEDVEVILAIYSLPQSSISGKESSFQTEFDGVLLATETARIPAGKFGLYYKFNHLYIGTRDAAGVLVFVRRDFRTVSTNLLSFITKEQVPIYLGETVPVI